MAANKVRVRAAHLDLEHEALLLAGRTQYLHSDWLEAGCDRQVLQRWVARQDGACARNEARHEAALAGRQWRRRRRALQPAVAPRHRREMARQRRCAVAAHAIHRWVCIHRAQPSLKCDIRYTCAMIGGKGRLLHRVTPRQNGSGIVNAQSLCMPSVSDLHTATHHYCTEHGNACDKHFQDSVAT